MQQPSAQQALSNETGFLQYASRADVLDIAHRADAEHRRLAQRPGRHLGQNFSHQASSPPGRCQDITAIETVRGTLAQRKCTADHIVVPARDHVSALNFGWRSNAPFDIGSGFTAAAVGSPYQIPCYLFVLSVAAEDGIDIHKCDWPQQEAGGLEGIWWHISELSRGNGSMFRRMEPIVGIVGIASVRAVLGDPIAGPWNNRTPVPQHRWSRFRLSARGVMRFPIY